MSKYYWTPKSGPIDEWLKKTKPSLVTDDDTPWIFVGPQDGADPEAAAAEDNQHSKAIGAASVVLDGLMKELVKIEKDDSIPVRAKKGQKSKKVVREEAQAKAVEEIKKKAQQYGFTCGKWMLFPKHEDVDRIWGQVARSIAYGPLKDAGVTTAKVAPSSGEERPHLICIYFADVYDLDLVRKIITVLLTEHGLEPNSVKSDLYTLLGIDSNHPSKLRSTIWRPAEVIEGGNDGIKALKGQYDRAKEASYKDRASASKASPKEETAKEQVAKEEAGKDETPEKKSVSFEEVPTNATKRKEPEEKEREKKTIKRVKSSALAFKENDMFAGSDEDDD